MSILSAVFRNSDLSELTVISVSIWEQWLFHVNAEASARAVRESAFGPAFPPETMKGIAFKATSNDFSSDSDEFFNGYSENLTSNSLELKSHEFYTERECEDDINGETRCHTYTRTNPVILKIRLTPKYLVYERETEYVYCWK